MVCGMQALKGTSWLSNNSGIVGQQPHCQFLFPADMAQDSIQRKRHGNCIVHVHTECKKQCRIACNAGLP